MVKDVRPAYSTEQIEECLKWRKVRTTPNAVFTSILKDGNEEIVREFLEAESDLAAKVAKHAASLSHKFVKTAMEELPALDPDIKEADGTKKIVPWPDLTKEEYAFHEARLFFPRALGCTISIHCDGTWMIKYKNNEKTPRSISYPFKKAGYHYDALK